MFYMHKGRAGPICLRELRIHFAVAGNRYPRQEWHVRGWASDRLLATVRQAEPTAPSGDWRLRVTGIDAGGVGFW